MSLTRRIAAAVVFAAFGLAPVASANSQINFDLGAIYDDNGGFGQMSGSGGTRQYYLDGDQTGTGVGVTISGWQAGSNTNYFANRTGNLIDRRDGMGLRRNEWGNQRGIDSANGYDLVIFQFDRLVSLDQIDLGIVGRRSTDHDFSLFSHSSAPDLDNNTFRYDGNSGSMIDLGWNLVGNYDTPAWQTEVNGGGIWSSFWAIGAYTAAVVVDGAEVLGAPDAGDDYFTLRNLVASVQDAVAVAEPSTAGLMLLAVLMIVVLRRRHRSSEAPTDD